MSAKKLTQEEKVLLAIFRTPHPAQILKIGQGLGLTDKSCRHAVHLLLHGNFVKKADGNAVQITEHGKQLCQILLMDGC
jgi:predicted transcriptional regulator